LDDRHSVLYVHGQSEGVLSARQRVEEHLSMDRKEPIHELKLRPSSGGYPVGLMKALVVVYGPNLEGLHSVCPATLIELILRRHIIRIRVELFVSVHRVNVNTI